MTVPVSRIALALLALASCSVDVSVPEGARISCAATTECQSGLRCLLGRQGGRCVSGADVCLAESGGELVPRAEGAPCQLPDGASGFCVDAACAVSRCGDGFLDRAAGEECDDGGRNSDTAPDACRTTCKRARCGDGVLDSDESCDGAPAAGANAQCLGCVFLCDGRANEFGVALDAGWADCDGDGKSCECVAPEAGKLTGAAKQAEIDVGGVAFDGQHLYWIDVGDDFATPPRPLAAHRAPWTGKSIGAAERLSSGCTGLPTSYSGTAIQVDESHAYFLANELFRVPRGGGTCERVGGKFVYSFAIRGDALFTDEGGEILRYRKAQPTAAAPVTKVDTVKGLAAGDDFLAFFDPLRGLVHSVPPAGAAAPTVMAARQFGTSTLLVSGREILWFDGNQALHAVPAGGGEPRLVARQPGAQTARAIQAAVISGQRVLFLVEGTSYQVGGLMSVPLAGGPLRMVAQLRVDANNVHRLVASGTTVLAVQSGSPARVFAFDVR